MARTNIDIDERLLAEVMSRYHLATKRSAVDYALRSLILEPMSREQVLAMRGTGIEVDNDEVEGDVEA